MHMRGVTIHILTILAALLAILLTLNLTAQTDSTALSRFTRSLRNLNFQAIPRLTTNISTSVMKRTPVYFVSHGGPNTMFEKDHPVFPKLEAIGKEITQKVKPSAIVVFSAHWQAEQPNTIEVNTSEEEPLLYDFYGFPRHYYMEKFPNKGSVQISQRVISLLTEAGIKAIPTDRGLDHGVFVPFKIMFNPETNPVGVPIVQVSLFDDDTDAASHIKLGRAVQKLREENVQIIVSGMAVHNLRHLMMTMGSGKTMPYAVSFDSALKEAVETQPGDDRDRAMENLLKRPDSRQAHPTFEHLIPIHVGVGAAGSDTGKQLWTLPEGSMSWGQYRFGEIEV